ncbi:unnamed protein product [Cuscuta epithymum]|uniref:Uncharacterized protein n=1 Tax=Cuscuta epithymum TaxID=186058 RepID=A0AAV0EUD2_9ASTE|nr:unnamed protein product [Cuscuta epithymum]
MDLPLRSHRIFAPAHGLAEGIELNYGYP